MVRKLLIYLMVISTSFSAWADGFGAFAKDWRWEAGLFTGMMLPPARHELYEVGVALHRPLEDVAAEVGLRGGVFPCPYGGVELEGAFMPTATNDGYAALVYAGRLQFI